MAEERRFPWRLLAVVAAVAALAVLTRLLPLDRWLEALQHWVQRAGAWGYVAYGAVYVVATLALFPGAVLTVGAGLVFGVGRGTALVLLSATVSAALGFLIARHLARAPVERWAAGHERFRAIDAAITEQGWKVVALLRLSPLVPFSLSNYLYGLSAVRFWPYVLSSTVAMLPGTLLYVSLGAAGRAAVSGGHRRPVEWVLLGAGLAATAVASVLIARAARRELGKRHLGSGNG